MRIALALPLFLCFACSENTVGARNAAPEAQILSHEDGQQVDAELEVSFFGSGSDADHEAAELTASWYVDDTEVCPAAPLDESGNSACTITLGEGEHDVRLEVEDPKGSPASDIVSITAYAEPPQNQAPSCEITAPLDNEFGEEGAPLDLSAQVGDDVDAPEGLGITWSSDHDGELGQSTAAVDGSVSFTADDLSANTHVIALQVVDSEGESCSDQVIYSVGSPPSMKLLAPGQGDLYDEGTSVGFSAQVSDGQDAPESLQVSFDMKAPDFPAEPTPDSTGLAEFTREDIPWGEYALTVTVTDSDGLYAQEAVEFQVNGLPSQPEISIDPAEAYTDDQLQVELDAESVDPEGDQLTYGYAWYEDGAAAGTTSTISSAYTDRGETWSVVVTPYDEHGSAGESATASVTILNSAPTAPLVLIEPQEPLPDESLLCTVDSASSDADGDTVSYSASWDVDGVAYAATSTTLYSGDTVPAGVTLYGEVWTCTLTPDDGLENGPAGTDSVEVSCQLYEWYDDLDGDEYGDPDSMVEACEEPGGMIADGTDCDDSDAEVNPDATEWCDGIDNDCDGVPDEYNAADADPYYLDSDGDGYGDASSALHACSQPTGYVADDTDCDDGDASVHPWAGDSYGDGVDGDCDTLDCEADSDGNTYFAVCLDDLGWHDGRADCQDMGHDDLASIQSASEQAFVEALLVSAGAWSTDAPWIGYADEVVESYWGWSDGSGSTYDNWSSGEPNGGSSENCAQLNWPLESGEWNDADCYDTSSDKGYVCEIR